MRTHNPSDKPLSRVISRWTHPARAHCTHWPWTDMDGKASCFYSHLGCQGNPRYLFSHDIIMYVGYWIFTFRTLRYTHHCFLGLSLLGDPWWHWPSTGLGLGMWALGSFSPFPMGLKEEKYHTIPHHTYSSVQKNTDMDQAPPWPPGFSFPEAGRQG